MSRLISGQLSVEQHLIPAVDEVLLAATVIRPPECERTPVVILRTPYDRRLNLSEGKSWARRGFACVLVDVRGRFGSEGQFVPYRHEQADGAAVLEWVHRSKFCDGRVLLYGSSYSAYCAVATAAVAAAPITGVIAAVPAMGLGETARESGGAARLACRIGWWSQHGGTVQPRSTLARQVYQLPVRQMFNYPGWAEMWAAPRRAPLWTKLSELNVPLLAVGGLCDPFCADTVELSRVWGGPTRLLIGPWGHRLDLDNPGKALAGQRIGEVYVSWAMAVLTGRLVDTSAWLATIDHHKWYRWSSEMFYHYNLTVDKEDFLVNPQNPFPSRELLTDLTIDIDRSDRAVLYSPTLPPGILGGEITLYLQTVADTSDADWVARLAVVTGEKITQITHSIIRLRAIPGKVTECVMRLGPICLQIAHGDRIRIEIAGHHWPRHALNPHTGVDPVEATEFKSSQRKVLSGEIIVPYLKESHRTCSKKIIQDVIR